MSFGYNGERIIDDLDLSIEHGDFAVIKGKNGCGKSTLIKLILNELKREFGSIKVLGESIDEMKSYAKIGYVPQVNTVGKIGFPVTCLELVTLGLYDEFGFIKIPRKKHKERAVTAIEKMGMGEYIKKPFYELSGGQQQRIMIARAIVKNPEIIILDEPTVGIDQSSKESFFEFISKINIEKKVTILMITHELEDVRKHMNKLFTLENGVIENASI